MRSLALLAFLLSADAASACTCGIPRGFLQTSHEKALVVRGRVMRHVGQTAMKVMVEEVLAGRAPGKTIKVVADGTCGVQVSKFRPDSMWVFRLYPHSGNRYGFGVCSTDWLEIVDQMAVGYLEMNGPEAVYASDVAQIVRTGSLRGVRSSLARDAFPRAGGDIKPARLNVHGTDARCKTAREYSFDALIARDGHVRLGYPLDGSHEDSCRSAAMARLVEASGRPAILHGQPLAVVQRVTVKMKGVR